MFRKLFFTSIILVIISCSTSKKTTSNELETTISQAKTIKKTANNELNNKINTIITDYLGVSISSIARSAITTTENGYHWKFMNVKTGENFIANSNNSFSSVEIIKNKN